MHQPSFYVPSNRDDLTTRLVDVTRELYDAYDAMRVSLVEERRERLETSQTSPSETIAGRNRDADYASFAQWAAVQDAKCTIFQLEAERQLLTLLLGYDHASR